MMPIDTSISKDNISKPEAMAKWPSTALWEFQGDNQGVPVQSWIKYGNQSSAALEVAFQTGSDAVYWRGGNVNHDALISGRPGSVIQASE